MNVMQTFIVTVMERVKLTLSVEAESAESAAELLNYPNSLGITPIEKATLDLHITEIRQLSGDSEPVVKGDER